MVDKTIHAEGVVLATTDFGDAHRVVNIYTKEFGKIAVNAYGCRRPRSRLAAPTLMFNHVHVELIRGPKVDMIREAEIINFYPITEDLNRLAYACVLFEIVNQMTPLNQKDTDVFLLLLNALKSFVNRNPRGTALIAAVQFIAISGMLLRLDHCVRCGQSINSDCTVNIIEGGALCERCAVNLNNSISFTTAARSLVENMIAFDWNDNSHIILRADAINAIENIVLAHVRYIIERPLRSVKFLNQLRAMPATA